MLENILLVISVLLIVITLMQSSKASDAGQILGNSNEALFGKTKERGLELIISRFTMLLGLAFFGISLVMFIM